MGSGREDMTGPKEFLVVVVRPGRAGLWLISTATYQSDPLKVHAAVELIDWSCRETLIDCTHHELACDPIQACAFDQYATKRTNYFLHHLGSPDRHGIDTWLVGADARIDFASTSPCAARFHGTKKSCDLSRDGPVT